MAKKKFIPFGKFKEDKMADKKEGLKENAADRKRDKKGK